MPKSKFPAFQKLRQSRALSSDDDTVGVELPRCSWSLVCEFDAILFDIVFSAASSSSLLVKSTTERGLLPGFGGIGTSKFKPRARADQK